jgi:dienelactone hydrolase
MLMKRSLVPVGVGLLVAGLVAGVGPSVAAKPPPAPSAWSSMRHQFDYQRQPLQVVEHGATLRDGAVVHDITYNAPGQSPVDAYLVTPARSGRHAGALFLHWLETPDVSNRGEFLDEAVALAGHGAGLVSLLPQLVFPFAYGPIGDERDRDSIVKQVIQLRRGLDLLESRADVDRHRVAVVGHDYGAMYASLLGAVDRDRVRSAVVMAADATFANWFVTFFLDLPPDAVAPYRALFASVDPINYVGHATDGGILLQYATDDFFIPNDLAGQIEAAAGEPKVVRNYAVDHSLDIPAARADRDAFLARTLRR